MGLRGKDLNTNLKQASAAGARDQEAGLVGQSLDLHDLHDLIADLCGNVVRTVELKQRRVVGRVERRHRRETKIKCKVTLLEQLFVGPRQIKCLSFFW